MGRHWSSRYWIFATTKRTLCVSELLQSLSAPTSLGKKMTRPELLSTRWHNLHVRDLTGDDAGVYLYRRPRCRSCPRAPQSRATDPGRERMPLLPRAPRPVLAACRHARSPPGPDADSQRLAVARCRSAPAGFQTADIFLHLRDAAQPASGERPWPGSRCWRKALGDFLASAPPR